MKNRQTLIEELKVHKAYDVKEKAHLERMIEFVESNSDCFERSLLEGHLTASALVVSPDRSHVLLLFHTKLKKWLQPGGHADGDQDLLGVALKECQEETGLINFQPIHDNLFDVDVHPIPERKDVPAHFHYDVRYLLESDPSVPLEGNHESRDLKWIPIDKVSELIDEWSVLRMVEKARLHR